MSVLHKEVKVLVLGRKSGEIIRIGDAIEITVVGITGNRVKLGIQAPKNVHVLRGELELNPQAVPANKQALAAMAWSDERDVA
jgi:carbon storage regulator